MENEKIVSIEGGLNDSFYASLVEQAHEDAIVENMIEQVQNDALIDSIVEQCQEDAMIDSMIEQAQEEAMIDAMIEQSVESAMIESMIEQAQEEAMIDAMIEQSVESAMIDSMIEQAQEEAMIDAMIEQSVESAMIDSMIEQAQEEAMIDALIDGINYGQKPDKQVDSWIAIYNDFSCVPSSDIHELETNNLLCFVHKKFERTSRSGKTAYFSYKIKDKDAHPSHLRMGNYTCKNAEQEHWVSWEYKRDEILENHWFTSLHLNSKDYNFYKTFIYPINYSFASEMPLDKYNPFNFSFKKLNFLKKGESVVCGDKISRVKIYNTKGAFLELSIYDFEDNIISLLKELNNSVGFVDFVITIHLKQTVNYLESISNELSKSGNEFIIRGTYNIINSMKSMLEKLSKFIPQSVKNNPRSDYSILISRFSLLESSFKK
ncbi:MAG: hypothetical protein V1775_18955 [Bacteroidota bacterium]